MYRHNQPGDIHFVTFKTQNNLPSFKDERNCDLFLEILNKLRQELRFKIFGFVILWDHVHLLIQLVINPNIRVDPNSFGSGNTAPNEFGATRRGEDNTSLGVGSNSFEPEIARDNISYVIKRIKGASAREINKMMDQRGIFWQKNFYDFNVYSDKKFQEKLDYIHKNPLKHGLVTDLADYKYSSVRNYELNDQSIFQIDYREN
jgi:REP element-mobilizing transposase RayT